MKYILLTLASFFCLNGFAQKSASFDFSEPPFWMPTHDEYLNLQKKQRDYYAKNVSEYLQKIPGYKSATPQAVIDLSFSLQDWDKMLTRVYETCQEDKAKKLCQKLEKIRLDAINLEANQKEENRNPKPEADK